MDYLKIGKAAEIEDKKDRRLYRTFEILPGLLAWTTLAIVILLSRFLPVWAAIFIIIFDIYWLIKTIYLSLHLRSAFSIMRKVMKENWMNKLESSPQTTGKWEEIYHLVIFPFYNEDLALVKESFEGLARQNYPKEKFIVVLAAEERAGEYAKKIAQTIENEFKDEFFKFLVTFHPKDIPGELSGKGSNIAWAGRKAKELIDRLGIPYENIIVSAFDIDTITPENYFARLTYAYLTTENRLRFSYQPVPFYVNNIWKAPSFARVVAFSSTFWHLLNQERHERLRTFSSHSMPFTALADVDFWQTNMVSEDSRIFFQCFLKYNGDYKVIPLYFPVYMDANVAPTFWQTIKNVYKQQRRWGWGAENIPYFLFGFLKNKAIPFKKKLSQAFFNIEGFWSWATNSFIIFLLGWLPVILGGAEFQRTVLSLNLPFITRYIMSAAMIGIASSAILSIVLLPPRPPQYGKGKHFLMILQWLLIPLTMITLGALPALEAQTRLMLGKYMGFWVTPKYRG